MKLEITGIEGSRSHVVEDTDGVIFVANSTNADENGNSALSAGIVGSFKNVTLLLAIHNLLKQEDVQRVLKTSEFIHQFIERVDKKEGKKPELTLGEIQNMISIHESLESIFSCLESGEVKESACTDCDNCTCDDKEDPLEGKSVAELQSMVELGKMLFGSMK